MQYISTTIKNNLTQSTSSSLFNNYTNLFTIVSDFNAHSTTRGSDKIDIKEKNRKTIKKG